MSMQHAQDILLFLVLAVNSDLFQIFTCSYSSHPLLWALVCTLHHAVNVIVYRKESVRLFCGKCLALLHLLATTGMCSGKNICKWVCLSGPQIFSMHASFVISLYLHTVHWECYFCCPKRLLLLNPMDFRYFPINYYNMYWQTTKERYLIL